MLTPHIWRLNHWNSGAAMTSNMGAAAAVMAMALWGVMVLPIRKAKVSGLYGLGVSIPAGVLVLLLVNGHAFRNMMMPHWPWQIWLMLLAAGACQFVLGTVFYYESVRYGELSITVPITSLKSVLVLTTVWLSGMEPVGSSLIWACVLGMSGLLLMVLQDRKESDAKTISKGVLFALLACASWGAGDILIKLITRECSAYSTTVWSLVFGLVIYYAGMLFGGQIRKLSSLTGRDAGWYAIHGIGSLGLGYWAFFEAIYNIGVAKAVIITTAWPLVSCLIGFLFFKEKVSMLKIMGALLLIGSAVLAV